MEVHWDLKNLYARQIFMFDGYFAEGYLADGYLVDGYLVDGYLCLTDIYA